MTSQFVSERSERGRPLRSVLRRLIPRDGRFFPLFRTQAALCVEGVEALVRRSPT